jgi:hypothetical protein
MRKQVRITAAVLAAVSMGGGCRGRVPEFSVIGVNTAIITGELGYPSDWVPPMTIYARETRSGEVFFARTNSSPSLTGYALQVSAPGTYKVFAWTTAGTITEESLGSYYCGGSARECEVPAEAGLREITVLPGDTLRGVDIFIFGDLPDRVPSPPAA